MLKPENWMPEFGVVLRGRADQLEKCPTTEVLKLLAEHGAIFFKDYRATPEQFAHFTERFSSSFIVHGAPIRKPISADGRTKAVNEGHGPIAMHSELQYTPFTPDVVWFYCKSAPEVGGQTTIADGVTFWRRLSSPAQKLFLSTKIRYRVVWSTAHWQSYVGIISAAQAVAELRKLGAINCEILTNDEISFDYDSLPVRRTYQNELAFANSIAVHAQYRLDRKAFQLNDPVDRANFRLVDGTPLPAEILEEVMSVGDSLTRDIPWDAGHFVMIDNHRVMHGRRAYDPKSLREVYTRLTNLPPSVVLEEMKRVA